MAWHSLVGDTAKKQKQNTLYDDVYFYFWSGYRFPSSFLLVYLITVSHFHPSFDEADYTLIQERESRFLQENFSIAQLRVHLFC